MLHSAASTTVTQHLFERHAAARRPGFIFPLHSGFLVARVRWPGVGRIDASTTTPWCVASLRAEMSALNCSNNPSTRLRLRKRVATSKASAVMMSVSSRSNSLGVRATLLSVSKCCLKLACSVSRSVMSGRWAYLRPHRYSMSCCSN